MIWEPPSEMSELKAASGPVGLVLNLSIYWNIEKQGLCQEVEYISLPFYSEFVIHPALSNGALQTWLKTTYGVALSLSGSCHHHEKHLPRLACWPRGG